MTDPKPVPAALGSGTTEAGIELRRRQKELAAEMRTRGTSLLANVHYVPELTKALKRRARRKAPVLVVQTLRRVK